MTATASISTRNLALATAGDDMDADGGRVARLAPFLAEGGEALGEVVPLHEGDIPAHDILQGRPGCGQRRFHVAQRLAGLLGQGVTDHRAVGAHCVLAAHVDGLRCPFDHHGTGGTRRLSFSTSPPPVPVLRAPGAAAVRRPLTASQVLSGLARDAVDLFAGPLCRRIRVCAAPDCGLLYLDQSRAGTRQWCSMQRCGTRAKVRTHRERRMSDFG
jgi:hypothetical protein